jgi:DNA segregation ATPase FtsK/SpoIIIE, S-DNA-T family
MFNFKKKNEVETIPYIVVVINDIDMDDRSIKEKYHDLVLRITQRSKAAGIHLVMLTSKPYQNISNQLGYIIPNRLAFRVFQPFNSIALLGTKDACHLRSDEYLCETYKHQIKKG